MSIEVKDLVKPMKEDFVLRSTTPTEKHDTSKKTFSASSASENKKNKKLDFVATSNCIKDIFSLPFQKEVGLSVAIHNIGDGTLVLESGDNSLLTSERDLSKYEKIEYLDDEGATKRICDQSLGKLLKEATNKEAANKEKPLVLHENEENRVIVRTEGAGKHLDGIEALQNKVAYANLKEPEVTNKENVSCHALDLKPPEYFSRNSISPPETPRQYLNWSFHEMQLVVASDAAIYHGSGSSTGLSSEKTQTSNSIVVKVADNNQMMQQRRIFESYVAAVTNNKLPQLPSYADAVKITKQPQRNDTCMQLQTCIVPSAPTSTFFIQDFYWNHNVTSMPSKSNNSFPLTSASISSTICTCLDAYLDNIMANVPQLALCLEEKGFIQSVKLLNTKDIPTSRFYTYDSTQPNSARNVFQPNIVDLNATVLLRFLKDNCTTENSIYLLHQSPGSTQVKLYDVSSISSKRQRKWISWLATISYRFALRLKKLSQGKFPYNVRKNFRDRERNLLCTSLDLMLELADMDSCNNELQQPNMKRYETVLATVYELLADTYLQKDDSTNNGAAEEVRMKDFYITAEYSSKNHQQPYHNVSMDGLTKAQDYLENGIRTLTPLQLSFSDENSPHLDGSISETIALQLFGLHYKVINVCIRLVEHHLKNYFCSSVMQSIRNAAKNTSDALSLLLPFPNLMLTSDGKKPTKYLIGLFYQFSWIWEYCGHFARSFAADDLWRERGHAGGNDVIETTREVESVCEKTWFNSKVMSEFIVKLLPITKRSGGKMTLFSLQPLIYDNDEEKNENVMNAKHILDTQKTIQRDRWRVLLTSVLCYMRAIETFEVIFNLHENNEKDNASNSTMTITSSIISNLRKCLGDSCNEIGKTLLSIVKDLLRSPSSYLQSFKSSCTVFLQSAQFWFEEGLTYFELCKDERNVALLRCNLCQCCKIRANSYIAAVSQPSIIDESDLLSTQNQIDPEMHLQDAAKHLQLAHVALHQRDTVDSRTWDMVSEELAATYLILGVRRRQKLLGGGANTPVHSVRLTPGNERSIIQPMEQALQIYTTLNNLHQVAAANYQLALFYSKIWTCQRDEKVTRQKLSAAFIHFQNAHSYFFHCVVGNEPTFVILCLDLSNLYSAVSFSHNDSSSNASVECTLKALSCCLDTIEAFSEYSVQSAKTRTLQSNNSINNKDATTDEWFSKMHVLAKTVEERVFKLLLNLVKMEKEKKGSNGKFKDMYRELLLVKQASSKKCNSFDTCKYDYEKDSFFFTLHEILSKLKICLIKR